jgi:uncharacterized membrane protein
MANKNNRLVVAYYANRAAAEAAGKQLKDWDKANDAIKLGAIAVMYIDPKSGELKADEVGQRQTGSGALWGTAIGAVAAVLSGGLALIPGLIIGATGGAVVGSLFHKDVGMSDAEQAEMLDNLRTGAVALAVMADDFEVEATQAQMIYLGGKAQVYVVPEQAAEALTAAADAQASATAAIDDTVSEVAEETVEVVRSVSVDLPGVAPEAAAAVAGLVAVSDLSSADAAKLHDAGVAKASELLQRGATPKGREELAAATGVSTDVILMAVKRLDLMRVKGVGFKYAKLLLASGIDTVPELGTRNPGNLLAKMTEVNAAEQIVDALPSEHEVAGWVAQAKDLPRVIVF